MSTEARKFPEPQPFTDKARPPIALRPVESSQIARIGYDEASKTLAVQFKHGAQAVYHYQGVEPETHEAFITSESLGKFFRDNLKTLPFEKFPAEAEPNAQDKNAEQAAADGLAQTPVEA